MFVATEVLAESRRIGELTEEMAVAVALEDFKSALVTFAIWGSILGASLGMASLTGRAKLPVRIVVGTLLGALGGLAAAYLSNRYSRFSEPPTDFLTYWLVRWIVVLLPVATALGFTNSLLNWSPKMIFENLGRAVVGMVLGVLLYVLSMGWLTPIEQAQYLFPGFRTNSCLLIVAVGTISFVLLNWNSGINSSDKKGTKAQPTPPEEGGASY